MWTSVRLIGLQFMSFPVIELISRPSPMTWVHSDQVPSSMPAGLQLEALSGVITSARAGLFVVANAAVAGKIRPAAISAVPATKQARALNESMFPRSLVPSLRDLLLP